MLKSSQQISAACSSAPSKKVQTTESLKLAYGFCTSLIIWFNFTCMAQIIYHVELKRLNQCQMSNYLCSTKTEVVLSKIKYTRVGQKAKKKRKRKSFYERGRGKLFCKNPVTFKYYENKIKYLIEAAQLQQKCTYFKCAFYSYQT